MKDRFQDRPLVRATLLLRQIVAALVAYCLILTTVPQAQGQTQSQPTIYLAPPPPPLIPFTAEGVCPTNLPAGYTCGVTTVTGYTCATEVTSGGSYESCAPPNATIAITGCYGLEHYPWPDDQVIRWPVAHLPYDPNNDCGTAGQSLTAYPFANVYPSADFSVYQPALFSFERIAIANYLASYGLPTDAGSIDQLIYNNRNLARAIVFGALLQFIDNPSAYPLPGDTNVILDWATALLRNFRVATAQVAYNEYLKWSNGGGLNQGCGYQPPTGYGFNAYQDSSRPSCYLTLFSMYGFESNIPVPPFAMYGAVISHARLNQTNGVQVASGTMTEIQADEMQSEAASGYLASGIVAGAITKPLVARYPARAYQIFKAIRPFTGKLYDYADVIKNISAGTDGSRAGLAAAQKTEQVIEAVAKICSSTLSASVVAVAGTAVEIATSLADMVKMNKAIANVKSGVHTAQTQPLNLQAIVNGPLLHSADSGTGTREFYGDFIEATLFPGDDPVDPNPLPAFSAETFTHQAALAQFPHQDINMKYLTWDGSSWSAQYSNGVFYHTGPDGSIHADRHLNYIDWDGTPWTLERFGSGTNAMFVHISQDGSQIFVSPLVNYRTWDNGAWSAFLGNNPFPQSPATFHCTNTPADSPYLPVAIVGDGNVLMPYYTPVQIFSGGYWNLLTGGPRSALEYHNVGGLWWFATLDYNNRRLGGSHMEYAFDHVSANGDVAYAPFANIQLNEAGKLVNSTCSVAHF